MKNLSTPTPSCRWWGSRLIISFLIFLAFPAQAANPLDIVINEIAWMGTETSYNDEWIELYNNTDSPINLDGWILKSNDGTPEIYLDGNIASKSYYLLERTDDNTVLGILADKTYKGSLENAGEVLELYDNFGNLIDSLNCSQGWFAGDNKTKQTMERKNPLASGNDSKNWQTSKETGGTPKKENERTEERTAEKLIETGSLSSYHEGIVFNEILPSPKGPDDEEEWIEIFNQNNFEVDISSWRITDTIGRINTYIFPLGTKISAQGFLVLPRPTTKITLNNDEDGLLLIQPSENILDNINYQKAPRGHSYNQTNSDWHWSVVLTPGAENIVSLSLSAPTETGPKTAKDSFSQESNEKILKMASVGEQFLLSTQPFFLFGGALALAVFSGLVIFVIKKRLKIDFKQKLR